ncbi:efflux RND transporter permease subunit [Hymenobacter guriensis]|uniref:MMPL family transporter n=1 Tax=Hymenobacter guriensis TaxID=2793065 RepID=A0ABS0L6U6_9BACT|nr:MMPL family transporter [Hymenobacter guriensis]MBG8555645.1 MMPL family transporter [Hymenobacter guriensis]
MIDILYRFRFWLLALVAALVVVLAPGVRTAVQIDNSLSVWFLEGDPALRAYRDYQARFGNDEVVTLVVHDSVGLLRAPYLESLPALSQELAALPDVAVVLGPGTTTIASRGLLAGAHPLLSAQTTEAQVRQDLSRLPTLQEQLFSPDFQTTRLLIELKPSPTFDARRGEILGQIREAAARHLPQGHYWLGGVGVLYAGLNALSEQDFGRFLGLGYGLMFLALLLLYRNLRLLLYVVGIVGLATYLTLGVYGAMGYRLNLMTVLLPMILILLGIMDALHIINERNLVLTEPGQTPHSAALEALRQTLAPCLATMLTTAAGFLALVSSPMAILRTFGAFAALGIVLCLCFTFLLGVLLLPGYQGRPRATMQAAGGLARLYTWVDAHPRQLTALALVLTVAAAFGALRLRADTYTLGYFPDDHAAVRDHAAMQRTWGAYMPLELLVEPRPGHTLHEAAVVQAAAAFADSARTLEGVGRVAGFHTLYLAGLETVVPASRARAALGSQSLLNRVHARLIPDYPQLTRQFIDEQSSTGRITVAGPMLSARELTAKSEVLLRMARHTLGPVATVRAAGYQPLYARIVDYVTRSQASSLGWSAVVIFGLVWWFVGSFRLALLTLAPNLLPVLLLLGLMGWAGIALDTATASIAAIVLSLCTDDTVHFVHHYQQLRRQNLAPAAARFATITHVGPTILLSSGVLFVGYLAMTLASLKTVMLFGLLTAVSIAAAFYAELLVFPLLLARFDREESSEAVENGAEVVG